MTHGFNPQQLAAYLHDLGMMLTLRAELRAELQPLSATEQEVLRMVQQRPGIRPADVADELGVARANLSTVIRKLIGLGLMLKTPDARDRRSAHLHLSPVALSNVDLLEGAWGEVVAAALDRLDDADRAAIEGASGALGRLRDML